MFIFFFLAIEVGPQPNGVLRADIFNMMKEALDLTIEWLQKFNSGKKQTPLFSVGSHTHLSYSRLDYRDALLTKEQKDNLKAAPH